jgi:hypothetical protein
VQRASELAYVEIRDLSPSDVLVLAEIYSGVVRRDQKIILKKYFIKIYFLAQLSPDDFIYYFE